MIIAGTLLAMDCTVQICDAIPTIIYDILQIIDDAFQNFQAVFKIVNDMLQQNAAY